MPDLSLLQWIFVILFVGTVVFVIGLSFYSMMIEGSQTNFNDVTGAHSRNLKEQTKDIERLIDERIKKALDERDAQKEQSRHGQGP